MTQVQIAKGYEDAIKLVGRARMDSVSVDVVWQKLHRVSKYLNERAAIELAPTLTA